MVDLTRPWKAATDRGRWATRGGTFVAKLKATKVVWFPPEPVTAGEKAASRADRATKQAGGTAGKTAKKTAGKTAGKAGKAGTTARKTAGKTARKTAKVASGKKA